MNVFYVDSLAPPKFSLGKVHCNSLAFCFLNCCRILDSSPGDYPHHLYWRFGCLQILQRCIYRLLFLCAHRWLIAIVPHILLAEFSEGNFFARVLFPQYIVNSVDRHYEEKQYNRECLSLWCPKDMVAVRPENCNWARNISAKFPVAGWGGKRGEGTCSRAALM